MEMVKLETGGDISDGGDLGEVGVWKSTGDMRAGVVIAETYLTKRDGRSLQTQNQRHVNMAAHVGCEEEGREPLKIPSILMCILSIQTFLLLLVL